MARVTISFDLNADDDLNDVNYALYGASLMNVITELDEWLRGMEKYQDKTFVSIADMRAKLREETEGLPLSW